MRLLDRRSVRVAFWVMGALLLVAISLAMGGLIPRQPLIPLAVGVFVLALGVTAAEPAAIPLLAVPLLLVVRRAELGPVALSVSDLALAGATLAALVFTTRPLSAELRTLLWFNALYQVATAFTVIANPYMANAVEWVHAWMLVSGSLLVGWTIGRAGYAKVALSLFAVTILVLAFITLVHAGIQYARGDFSPVFLSWPYGMHKNFVGTVMGFGCAVVYARPDWMGWKRVPADVAFWIMALALLTTQSRQAIVGLGVAIIFIAWRVRRFDHRRSTLIAIAVVPALALVATLVKDQVESGNQFNSVFQRLTWFEETIEYWAQSPWVGHGLRFWYEGGPIGYQPPNVILEVGSSTGIVGLTAFIAMFIGIIAVLWRTDPRFSTVAIAIIASRLVQSQLDLYWAAVQASVPFLVAGIALGALAVEAQRTPWGRARRLALDVPRDSDSKQGSIARVGAK